MCLGFSILFASLGGWSLALYVVIIALLGLTARIYGLLLLTHGQRSHFLPSCASPFVLTFLLKLLLLLLLLIHLYGEEEQILRYMLLLLLLEMLLLQLLFLLDIVRTILKANFRFVAGIPWIRSRLLRILLRFGFFLRILERHIRMILWLLRLLLLLLRLTKVLKILLLTLIEPLRWYLCITLYRHLKILVRLLCLGELHLLLFLFCFWLLFFLGFLRLNLNLFLFGYFLRSFDLRDLFLLNWFRKLVLGDIVRVLGRAWSKGSHTCWRNYLKLHLLHCWFKLISQIISKYVFKFLWTTFEVG